MSEKYSDGPIEVAVFAGPPRFDNGDPRLVQLSSSTRGIFSFPLGLLPELIETLERVAHTALPCVPEPVPAVTERLERLERVVAKLDEFAAEKQSSFSRRLQNLERLAGRLSAADAEIQSLKRFYVAHTHAGLDSMVTGLELQHRISQREISLVLLVNEAARHQLDLCHPDTTDYSVLIVIEKLSGIIYRELMREKPPVSTGSASGECKPESCPGSCAPAAPEPPADPRPGQEGSSRKSAGGNEA